ncbi:hypothetical protein [Sporomusa malonica]|uniref:Uncharacterized protein n=1 Tax=Sporomusa malonica TaxID=112901 RepID=A0A1W2CX32_9FIRM|nr:hypothetical protein [Sporomusa malonica]SMC89238.1 hypothetical protein SAMN04488500_1122 [Sporomusa malonica]
MAGEESEWDPPDIAAKVGRKATWVATREVVLVPNGMRTFVFCSTMVRFRSKLGGNAGENSPQLSWGEFFYFSPAVSATKVSAA